MADMTITTGTKTRMEPVTDLDVGFISGVVRQFTLYQTDAWSIYDGALHIRTENPPSKIVIYERALAWTEEQVRMMEIEETTGEQSS